MGKLIYQKTIEPFRIYVYDNETEKKIVINRIVEYETGESYVQHFSCLENELIILSDLIRNAREVL